MGKATEKRQKVAKRRSPVRTRTDATASLSAPFRRFASVADHRAVRIIAAGALWSLAAFCLLALVTFTPGDPDFDLASAPREIGNRGGVVGAYLAGTLLRAFGVAAFVLPFLLGLIGADVLRRDRATPLILRLPAGALLLLTGSALISMAAPEGTIFGLDAAGWIGHALGTDLIRRFFGLGGALLLVPPLLVAVIGTVGMQGVRAVQRTAMAMAAAMGKAIQEATIATGRNLRQASRRRREAAEAEPEAEGGADARAKPAPAAKKARPRFVAPDEESLPAPDRAQRSSHAAEDTIPELEIEQPKAPVTDKAAIQPTLVATAGEWQRPDVSLLTKPTDEAHKVDEKVLRAKAQILEHKIKEYGIEGRVTAVRPGPVISVYEFKPAPGVKVAKIANLEDDLALATESYTVRIVAPIPGRDVVGIEIPNATRDTVALRACLESSDFWDKKIKLPFALGKDTAGQPRTADLSGMPHLLMAGATGAGKSVGINCLITSLLYRHSPDELRLYLIDPKRLELSFYRDIPHLEGHDVVVDPHEALALLDALVREMEDRYDWMAHAKVRNLGTYQKAFREGKIPPKDGVEPRPLPYLVCIIDELADLMMVTRKAIEEPIARLAQMARAAGIHLVLATQRPSVDVITGLIKANFPTRLAFRVSSKADSRVVLDQQGAENLLGKGDMLFKPPTSDVCQRIHGAFVSEEEVIAVVDFWKAEAERHGTPAPAVSEDLIQESLDKVRGGGDAGGGDAGDVDEELFERAVEAAAQEGVVSTSRIQRLLGIGYNRAARIMDALEARGMVGPQQGAGKPRKFIGAGGGVDG